VTPAIRPAREGDLERLVDIHASAFPDPRDRDARLRNFTRNALGEMGDLWVLLEGGMPVAHGFLFALEAWFGGARVPVGGVATVGVAPEARGRGVGSRLLQELHEVSRARGDALTMLYAFRQGFYARMGYTSASSYRRLRLHPAAVPWRCELAARAASGGDVPQMAACLEQAAQKGTGRLVRRERQWERRLSNTRWSWLVVEGDGVVEGYVGWRLEQREAHAPMVLAVRDMAASTVRAERSLWGLVGAQRDQVAEVRVDVAEDDPLDRALLDADRARFGDEEVEHVVGEVVSGPMLRVSDVARALAARGWPRDGRLVLTVGEETLEVVAEAGRAAVVPSSREPDLRMSPSALAAVAFGALPVRSAIRLGWLTAKDDASSAHAADLLALPPYFSPDPF
jgi:predicted acetyltransferase